MIYQKVDIDRIITMHIPVDVDEFYCTCPICGKEVHLDYCDIKDVINEGENDFLGTDFYCEECSLKHSKAR